MIHHLIKIYSTKLNKKIIKLNQNEINCMDDSDDCKLPSNFYSKNIFV